MKRTTTFFTVFTVALLAATSACNRQDRFGHVSTEAIRNFDTSNLNPELIHKVQAALKAKGYDVGDVSSILNAKTIVALQEFRKSIGLDPAGKLDETTLQALGLPQDKRAEIAAADNAPKASESSVDLGSVQLSRAEVRVLQNKLTEKGFRAGTADGILGKQTAQAISEFQRKEKLVVTGRPDHKTVSALDMKLETKAAE